MSEGPEQSRSRLRLLTRGDDAGSSRSANRAIREAFEEGILRNVSVIAPGSALADAAEVLAGLKGLCAGLHVTLNCEWDYPRWGPVLPAGEVPSLVDDRGQLLRTTQELNDREPDVGQMLAEAEAQLSLLREVGFEVAYLDQHMGVGWVGGLGEALADLARREGLIDDAQLGRHYARLGGRALGGSGDLAEEVRTAPNGTHLIVGHPCYDDQEMAAFCSANMARGAVGIDRDRQRRMFLDPPVLAACAVRDAELVRYTDVWPPTKTRGEQA